MGKRRGKETLYSRQTLRANTGSVSTTKCPRLRRRLWISRLRYVFSGFIWHFAGNIRLIYAIIQVENEARAQLPSKQGSSPNKPPSSKNPSLSSRHSCPRFHVTRSTSAHERTGILARSSRRRTASSTSA